MFLSRKYKLSVENPCHEAWEQMDLSAKGRFCDACAKNVIDFSGMSEKEIAAYFRNRPANVCGRFKAEQLQKVYTKSFRVKIPFHQRFFSYLISFFVSGAVANNVSAQTDTIAVVQPDALKKIAVNDTVLSDSTSVAVADSAAVDLLQAGEYTCIDSAEAQIPVKKKIKYTVITIVSGAVGIAPHEESSFIDLWKIKDSLYNYFRPVIAVTQPSPAPEKEPAKKEPEAVTAVLPEELRIKQGKRS